MNRFYSGVGQKLRIGIASGVNAKVRLIVDRSSCLADDSDPSESRKFGNQQLKSGDQLL